MERRLLFLLAAGLLLLQLVPPSASYSLCPDACLCSDDPRIKCTNYLPKLEFLNEYLDRNWNELWLDKIELAVFDNNSLGVDCSRPNFYCRNVESFVMTRCTWDPSNETSELSLAAKFISKLPLLKSLNISFNDFTSIEWCKDIVGQNITSFNVSHNRISFVHSLAFQGMSQLAELILANNKLDEAPIFRRLDKLQVLDLSNNQILRLHNSLEKLPELRRLNLAGNKISFVQMDYFQDLRSLVELDISRNAFVFIRPESLQSLTSLSVLNLSENRLIERDLSLLLDSVRRLEVVDASRIGLWRVPATLTRSVKIMRLVGNQLTAVNSGDFDSYPLLKLLDLSGNKLIMIEDDALGRLDDLEELNLYGNILSNVPKSLPSNLRILDLRQNTITVVNANDLRGLSKLTRLDLSGNVVSNIENGAFRHLTELRELDVSDNPIKRLTSDALNGPRELGYLRMAGLTEFKLDENQNQDTAFPYSTPERIVELDLSRSSSLAALFLADNATLRACRQLKKLHLSNTNVTSISILLNLYYVLPRLERILLVGNEFNCSKWNDEEPNSYVFCDEHQYIDFSRKREEELSKKRKLEFAESKRNHELWQSIQSSTTLQPEQQATTAKSEATTGKIENSSKSQIKKQIDMMVKPTATPPTTTRTTTVKYTAITTDLPATSTKTFATTQTKIQETTTPSTPPASNPSLTTFYGEERPDLFTQQEVKTSKPKVVNTETTTTPVEDNQTTTRLPSTARFVPTKKIVMTTTTRTTTEEDETTEAPPAVINLESDMTTTTYEEDNIKSLSSSNHMFSEFSRSKVLLANDEEQVSAEELINERGHRNSDFFHSGAHPGMLVLVGAVIGAAAALTVVLSRRATAKGREQYHRQENIALTPTTEQRW